MEGTPEIGKGNTRGKDKPRVDRSKEIGRAAMRSVRKEAAGEVLGRAAVGRDRSRDRSR
jgi:hypothetical protein